MSRILQYGLIATALWFSVGSVQAQGNLPFIPSPDNLPTLRYGSDLSNLPSPINPTDYFPLTRLKRLGPGSDEAPRSYTGYGAAQWLWAWTREQRPPLLFTQPGGRQIGDGDLPQDNQERLGYRVTVGWWLNNNQTLGVEATYLRFWQREPEMLVGPGVARPNGDLALAGRLADFNRLWGAEINGRLQLARWTGGHLDILGGVRTLQLEENLDVSSAGVDGITVHDRFGSHNQFWGAQLGLQGEVNYGPWSTNAFGKIGLGVNHQVVEVEGNRTVGDQSAPGGFFAQSSNMGRHQRDPFALLPEVGVQVAYRLTDNFRLTAGYSILWLTETRRPGEQIDGHHFTRPIYQNRDSTFWAQSLTIGLEYRW